MKGYLDNLFFKFSISKSFLIRASIAGILFFESIFKLFSYFNFFSESFNTFISFSNFFTFISKYLFFSSSSFNFFSNIKIFLFFSSNSFFIFSKSSSVIFFLGLFWLLICDWWLLVELFTFWVFCSVIIVELFEINLLNEFSWWSYIINIINYEYNNK